jgi:hypothetical protein
MSVASLNPGDLSGSHVKIGAPSHTARNIGVAIGLAVVSAAGFGFYRWSSAQDAQKLASLEAFRSAYAEKCDAPQWKGEPAPLVRDTFLNSSRLQDTIATQKAALDRGTPCEDVLKALKSADFPLPQVPKTAAE